MFVTLCTRDYLIGLEVLLQSLVDNNGWLKTKPIPFVVLSNEILPDDLVVAKKIYPHVELRNYDAAKYAELHQMRQQASAFGDHSKYEIFSIQDADRIIFLDVDTLVVGDISYLVDCPADFAAVRELYIDQFNTGVMAIGKKHLSPAITNDLIQLTKIYGMTEHLDQDIINEYFSGQIFELPMAYNFLKIYHKPIFWRDGLAKYVKILHYVVKKPWQQKPAVPIEEGTLWLERYWFSSYAKTMQLRHGVPQISQPKSALPPLRIRNNLGDWMTKMGYSVAAEVGVQKGEFSEHILSAWQGTLIMIDAWEHLPNYDDVSNVDNDAHFACMLAAQKVAQKFIPRGVVARAKSPDCAANYADGSFDLVYLDANHSYDALISDLRAWLPKVRKGGAIAGHDYVDGTLKEGTFGVKSAVNDFFGRQPDIVTEESWATWVYIV